MKFNGWISPKNEISLSDLINDLDQDSKMGAITTFTGLVRDISDYNEVKVKALEVEAWVEKGEIMRDIAKDIGVRYNLLGMRIVHLEGMLEIGDPIVYVVISSIHRKEAFDALEDAINAYKNKSPVWKKEIYEDGNSHWITTAHSHAEE